MDVEAIGGSIRNMKKERGHRGHINSPSISPRKHEGPNSQINMARATRDYTMATESFPFTSGILKPSSRRDRKTRGLKKSAALLTLLATAPAAMAQSCIPLSGSKTCPAFSSASISTDSNLIGFYPFLAFVSSTATFDQQLSAWVNTDYIKLKYQNLLGCGGINTSNASSFYARYTTTVICNGIVQNSRDQCSLTAANSVPVCAETCAEQAESEANIIANTALCTNTSNNAASQIRADFTNCALPANSLSGSCILGATNEPDDCGYGSNLIELCSFCASGSQNSTDTCCYNSKADSRCVGVVLPTITASISLATSTVTSTATSSATSASAASAASSGGSKLSGGPIAGIVIGSLAGLALLIGLIILLTMCIRRRRGSQHGSVFNQPSPPRKGQSSMVGSSAAPAGYEVLPGGRIARMSALEGHSGDSPPRGEMIAGGVAAGAAAGYAAGRRRHGQSSSDESRDSPESDIRAGVLRPPPTGRRNGSLSSGSALGADDPNSPQSGSGGDMSSPQGVASQQSEQLPSFKDYYSQDEIHPGDKVATLWAYQPRAGDEFLLERGDMLKVVGIWDDGWATGVMINDRAEDWDAKKIAQRDSGVSSGSGRRESSPAASGEIKAFPLVCVCLPEHWRKTIEGDGSTETGSSAAPHIA